MGTKFGRSRVCLHFQVENRLWQLVAWHLISQFCSSSLYFDNLCTTTGAGDKIKYGRLPKNTETQQENTKEILAKDNWNKLD